MNVPASPSLWHVAVPIWHQTSLVIAGLRVAVCTADWRLGLVTCVCKYGPNVAVVEVAATFRSIMKVHAEPVHSRYLVGVNDDAVPLANASEKSFDRSRFDGHKIESDDLHRVAVQAHNEVVVNGSILTGRTR